MDIIISASRDCLQWNLRSTSGTVPSIYSMALSQLCYRFALSSLHHLLSTLVTFKLALGSTPIRMEVSEVLSYLQGRSRTGAAATERRAAVATGFPGSAHGPYLHALPRGLQGNYQPADPGSPNSFPRSCFSSSLPHPALVILDKPIIKSVGFDVISRWGETWSKPSS